MCCEWRTWIVFQLIFVASRMSIVVYDLWICRRCRHLATFRLSSAASESVDTLPTLNIYIYWYVMYISFRFRPLAHKQCGQVNLHDRLATLSCYLVLGCNAAGVWTSISLTITIMLYEIRSTNAYTLTNNGPSSCCNRSAADQYTHT